MLSCNPRRTAGTGARDYRSRLALPPTKTQVSEQRPPADARSAPAAPLQGTRPQLPLVLRQFFERTSVEFDPNGRVCLQFLRQQYQARDWHLKGQLSTCFEHGAWSLALHAGIHAKNPT